MTTYRKKNKTYKVTVSSPLKSRVQTPKKNIHTPYTKTKQTQTSESLTRAPSGHEVNIDAGCTQGVASLNNIISAKSHVPSPPPVKNNICILSSETSNRIQTLSERTHLGNFNMCHYRTPRCGMKYLLKDIDLKVRNFSRLDYCIIFIGEDDFTKTHN